ncbi:hypothetical protein ACFQGT_06255 [Natrialbaceae archaeon GCM10025810]|uniref:hypothetical protein n=1 Tax=Halovalidus salilacus TaxID=3075124 RepID=UPI00361A830A
MDEPYTLNASKSIELPESVYSRVGDRVSHSPFDTPDEYVAFVLEEVLGRVEDASDLETANQVDQDEVETRLEALGYLE